MERRKNAYVYLVRESPEGATGRRDIVPKRSPFILDHKLFFEHIFNDRVVIPKDELTTLIHTSNQTIIEVFHYEEEAENPELLKVTLNKNNSAFKVFYFENQKWVSLTNKFETRSPVLNVRIRFKNKEFTFQFEMFNPFAEFQHPTFDKLMSCAKRHDFKKERDFEASKTYIRKQYFQCELEACEKATVKVNVNRDQGVIPFSVAKNLNFEMSEEKDEASDDLNAGFVKSTSKKGIDYSAELEGLSELVNKDRPSQGCRAIIEEEHHDQKNILGDEDCLESLNLSDELGDITEFQMLRSERNEANLSSKRKHLLIEQHMKEHTRGKEKNSPVREQSMEEVIHCCICYCKVVDNG
jgi:hypothetical protein